MAVTRDKDRAGQPRDGQSHPLSDSDVWDAFAPHRDRHREWTRAIALPVTKWLVDALAVQRGETVLELAAGVGDAGFAILERVPHGVRLISSDLSPAVVDVARRAASAKGLTHVDFRVLDAQNIDLPSSSVDAVICRWGYMLMRDPAAALHETNRVLRRGGRLAFSVWGDPAHNPGTTINADICRDIGYSPPTAPTDPGGMYSLADPDRLQAMVQASGLVVRRIETVPVVLRYAGVDDYIGQEMDQPGPRGDFFRLLSDEERAQASRLATTLLEPYRADTEYAVPGETLTMLATT